MAEIGTLTPEQCRSLWHDFLSRKSPSRGGPRVFEPPHRTRSAVIGSAMAAPSSSLVEASECTIYFIELQADGTSAVNETPQTAYNDDPGLTAAIGTYCRVEWKDSRWMIYYLGCNTQAALISALPEV